MKLILEGLDCANCAAKIEREIQKMPEVSKATVQFVTKTLQIDWKAEVELALAIKKLRQKVNKVEPDVQVLLEEEYYNQIQADDCDYHHNHEKKCNCNHKQVHSYNEDLQHHTIIQLVIGVVLFILGYFVATQNSYLQIGLYGISYLIIGGEVLWKSAKNIAKGQIFDENFLMAIATIGAFAIEKFPEAVAVMLFYQIGELFQTCAVNRSRKSISSLMDIRPDYANVFVEGKTKRITPEKVKMGEKILVQPGEKVPLDGIVLEGEAMLDTSALTGESKPRKVKKGDEILSGSVSLNGVLTIQVSKEFGESTVAKILNLVENASSKKASAENFITKFARYYTPIVVCTAVALALLPPLMIPGELFTSWLYRALVFLVISCPCALVISIPLSFFGGIGGASKCGILIKGGNYLEILANTNTVVFDKTGTLTKGVFEVNKIVPVESVVSKQELLEYAALGEVFSTHPIAQSIQKAWGYEVNAGQVKDLKEEAGYGIVATVKEKQVLIGNQKLLKRYKITFSPVQETGTIIYMAIDGQYAGYLTIADTIKPDTILAIQKLSAAGVKKTVMLTGDTTQTAREIAEKIGISQVHAELLPQQKVEKIEELLPCQPKGKKLAFVGDGINDAPVLARADIGIAMGGIGSDAAIEAADVVLMTDELSKISQAIEIARRTIAIVKQNIIFALVVKVLTLALGAFGIANMWEAVFADVGVSLIAILNALRVLRVKK